MSLNRKIYIGKTNGTFEISDGNFIVFFPRITFLTVISTYFRLSELGNIKHWK